MVCLACGRALRGAAGVAWVTVRNVGYRRCTGCGYVRMDDAHLPTAQAAEARYRLHRNDPAEPGYRRYLAAFVDRAVAPSVAPGARILDFGSGPEPALALLLRERGWDVACWDPYFATDRRSLRGPFAAVIVHEVLEHVRRPYATLAGLRRLLTAGGAVAIRTRLAPEDPEAFARWWYREDPTHVGFFRPESIRALASRVGCEVALLAEPDLAVLRLR